MRRSTVRVGAVWLGVVVLVSLSACEPMSEHAEGRDDAVRYQLPRGAMRLLEEADHVELLAIERPDDWPDDGPVWYDDLDASAVARVSLTRDVERDAAVAALYRGIARGRGVGLCFHPHHALRATRGEETLSVVVCLSCSQAGIGAESPLIAIEPGAIDAAWTPIIEAGSELRFDPEGDSFGRWVRGAEATGSTGAAPPPR